MRKSKLTMLEHHQRPSVTITMVMAIQSWRQEQGFTIWKTKIQIPDLPFIYIASLRWSLNLWISWLLDSASWTTQLPVVGKIWDNWWKLPTPELLSRYFKKQIGLFKILFLLILPHPTLSLTEDNKLCNPQLCLFRRGMVRSTTHERRVGKEAWLKNRVTLVNTWWVIHSLLGLY